MGSKQSLDGSEHSEMDGGGEAGFRSRTSSFNIEGSSVSIDRLRNGEKENWQQSIGPMKNGRPQIGANGIEMRDVGHTDGEPGGTVLNAAASQMSASMNQMSQDEQPPGHPGHQPGQGPGVALGHPGSPYPPSPQPGHRGPPSHHGQPGQQSAIRPHHPTAMHQLPGMSPAVTVTTPSPLGPDSGRITAQSPPGPHRTAPFNPGYPPNVPAGRSSPPQSRSRSSSPRRDVGFSAAVSNIVDQAHEIADRDRNRGGSFRRKGHRHDDLPSSPTHHHHHHHHHRGRSENRRPPLTTQRQVIGSPLPSPIPSRSNSREPLYRTTSLETRSRSPSPDQTPTPSHQHEYYGSANLTDRSRSPSPASTGASSRRKRVVRKLPATPQKPSSLNLSQARKQAGAKMPQMLPSPTIPQPHKSPGSINFPKLNASPTRFPRVSSPTAGSGRKDPGMPAPMGGRPRGYDTNDLNMPVSYHSSRERIGPGSRSGSHDHISRDIARERPRYSSQMLNNARHEPHGRNSRYVDGMDDRVPLAPGMGRSVSSSNLPNGYKPVQTRSRGDRTADHRGGPKTKTARREHSDSDDEDWC